jgi:two-component system, NarL family, nitrate/nitrite response regulator NarL
MEVAGRPGAVLVVDPNAASRSALTRLLAEAGLVVRQASSGEKALLETRRELPSVVILSVELPRLSGYEVCTEIREEFGELPAIIFVSGDGAQPHDRIAALHLGGDDFVARPFHAGEMLARVRRLLSRANRVAAARPASGLTPREREVLALLAEGMSQREISGRLVISPKTVGGHIQSILRKLGVHSQTQAVAYAYRRGLVTVDARSGGVADDPSIIAASRDGP